MRRGHRVRVGKSTARYSPTTYLTEDAAGIFRADNHAWLFAVAQRTRFPRGAEPGHALVRYRG